ncbi:MAG: amidohydrolase family protein [Rubrobacteraceae bacterium]
MGEKVIFAADLVFPVSSEPVRDGAVLVEDGRISSVGKLSEVRGENPDAGIRDFSGCSMAPGAVNAHAHLSFRREDGPGYAPFAEWLGALISRLEENDKRLAQNARDGSREAIEAGTTFMAESSPYGGCLPYLAGSGMAGTCYAEFFPHESGDGTPEGAVEFIMEKVRELNEGLPPRVNAQVSVHSPYTVDPESARLAARRTREAGERLAIHLSESPEECEFVMEGTGGLAGIFSSNPWGGMGISPVKYGERVELLAPQTIAAHLATGVGEEELEILTRTGVAAAHCPRSNENLGCDVSPVAAMMERGVRVGMGTDGLWSSQSLNLFEETLFAVELHGFDGKTGLRLATLEGARALGIEDETGSIEAGKWADLAVIEVAPTRSEPEREVLEAAAGDGAIATVVGGKVIHDRTEG